MWAHSEKSIMAESMGTGVVPWLWLWELALYGVGGSGRKDEKQNAAVNPQRSTS